MPSEPQPLGALKPRAEGRSLRAEIHLGRLARNVRRVEGLVQGRGILAVVKANAYGHGAVRVARALEEAGVAGLCVSTLEEALELREGGLEGPVLVLGGLRPDALPLAHQHGLSVALVGPEHLAELAEAVPRWPVPLHLKLDTGMGRLGILPGELGECMDGLRALAPWLQGVMGHFATADDQDQGFAHRQRAAFHLALASLSAAGLTFRQVHHANSDACLRGFLDGDTHVRPGLALFGLTNLPEGRSLGLEPVLELLAEVYRVKGVPAGTAVGYGRTFVAPHPLQIATLGCGYADGYRRELGNRASVGFRGAAYPVVGRVSMDYLTVALPLEVPIRPGDPVTLLSPEPEAPNSVERIAQMLGTLPYEVTCGLHRRMVRVFSR
ncbi:MAG: alanine racemase [Acidobacteria bacterium]|nr:alanine racemase [Acidobacteriota bacterium]